MSNENKPNDNVELLLELAKLNGVACSTVSDGHVLVFSKNTLKSLLDQCDASGQDQVVLFVKRPDVKNAN